VTDGRAASSDIAEVLVQGAPAGKPTITQIRSQFGQIYLEGADVTNKYTVSVDWNGSPGVVQYAVNGKPLQVTGNAKGADFDIDVTRDLRVGQGSSTNTISVIAANSAGGSSAPMDLHPQLIPLPDWIRNLAVTVGNHMTVTFDGGGVTYHWQWTFPNPPFEARISIPESVPLFGGQLGIPPSQAKFSASLSSFGRGTIGIRGQTSFDVAKAKISGSLGGYGTLSLGNGVSLDALNFSIDVGGTVPLADIPII
jgi:hypothetical protein